MSAATSPGTGLAYGLQRVCAAWGFARSSFYAMKSRQQATAERPPAKRRGPKPSIIGRGSAGGRGRPGGAPPEARDTARSGLGFGSVVDPVSRKRVLRVARTTCLAPSLIRRGGNPHVGEIISGPQPHVGHGRRSGVHGGRRPGAGYSPPSSIGTPSASAGMRGKRGDRFAALQPISMGLARLYASTSGCGAGAGLADGSRLPGCRTTSPTRSSSGASSRPTPSSNSPRPTASPRGNRTLKEQIIHGRATGAAERRPRVRRTMPSGSWRRTAT